MARQASITVVAARAPFVSSTNGPRRAPGGLVSALLPLLRRTRGTWIATGAEEDACEAAEIAFRVRALSIPSETRVRWYRGASNGALWPLAHGFIERCRFRNDEARAYRDVCKAAADAAAEIVPPRSTVWVHDYQLALVPALLRARRPDLEIGFFWHVPWPAAELFRVLPWADELVSGLLGADLIGLHVPRYVRAFRDALSELGVAHDASEEGITVPMGSRRARVAACPIGVDVPVWSALGRDEGVVEEASRLRAELGASRVLLAVDRMDYAKGIVERLEAFERVLEQSADAREHVSLLQIGVPTRESVDQYCELRKRIEATVGRIQGRFGAPGRVPVHLLSRSFEPRNLAPFYVAADAALVTPMRDGMNLVAFEYVATRSSSPSGRLLLSSMAGAADVLTEAEQVNPYDEDELTRAIERVALSPETDIDKQRMSSLAAKVARLSVDGWITGFLSKLEIAASEAEPPRSFVGQLAHRIR